MKIHLQNVGKHTDYKINLPTHGAYLLKGPNGAGKSTVLAAILGAYRLGKMPAITWGVAQRGSVDVDGLHAAMGANVRVTGSPDVKVVDLTSVLDLSDPGFSDPKAAEKARQRQFAALTGARSTPAAMLGSEMPGPEMDLPSAAESARIEANNRALAAERLSTDKGADVVALTAKMPPAVEAPTVAEATDRLRLAERAADIARTSAAARLDMESRQAAARASHGDRPSVDAVIVAGKDARALLDAARETRERAEAALREAQAAEAAASARVDAERDRYQATVRAAERWDETSALLSSPVTGASAEDVEAAAAAVDAARGVLQSAKDKEARERLALDLSRVVADRDAAEAEGKRWRDEAQRGIPARVAAALSRVDAPGWGIGDVLMCADPDRGGELVPFSDLSDGRRLAAAVDLALRGRHDAGILILPQERGSQLDGAAWARLDAIARDRGVFILSAILGEGALDLVSVGGAR